MVRQTGADVCVKCCLPQRRIPRPGNGRVGMAPCSFRVTATTSSLRLEGEHPGIVILVRRRTRQAEIAAMQKLLTGAGAQGLSNNINFA